MALISLCPAIPGGRICFVFEIGENAEKDFDLVRSIINLNTFKEVFLTSTRSDPSILVQAIRVGAKNFFPQPLAEPEVKEALKGFKERVKQIEEPEAKGGQIIDLIGSKGGVGVTTIAVNLAANLLELEGIRSVALVDMNLLTGEIPIFLDVDPPYHWGEIVKNISRLDSTYLMSILTSHSSGIYVLPSPSHLDGNFLADPGVIEHLLALMKDVFDFIIIDGGQPLDDIALHILELSDEVLLVGVMTLPCLANMNKILRTFSELGYLSKEKVKIVMNRYLKKSEISLKEAQRSIDKAIFWQIPNDFITTNSAINQGKLLTQLSPKSSVNVSLKNMAMALSHRGEKKSKGGLLKLFGRS